MILVIDNYDSFTFNLVQLLGTMDQEVQVVRNDAITPDEVEQLAPTHLLLSPGPGHPAKAGCLVELVRRFHDRLPILGVCLGHQALSVAAGGQVGRASQLMHGKASPVVHDGTGLFRGMPEAFPAARYHSLCIPAENLPDCLEVCARTEDGEIMAVRWRNTSTVGVQFHPESILTPDGPRLLANFLEAPGVPC